MVSYCGQNYKMLAINLKIIIYSKTIECEVPKLTKDII